MKLQVAALLLVTGCGSHTSRELQGDRAWHAGRFADAVNAYRAAGDNPRVTAKLAEASLQSGQAGAAIDTWVHLAGEEPTRAGEAAAGIARVAYLAAEQGNASLLAQSIAALQRVAPGWPLGRLAARLDGVSGLTPAQQIDVIPAVVAGVEGRAAADPLLFRLAEADRTAGTCRMAVPILEGVLRRDIDSTLSDSANVALSECELRLGLGALDSMRAGEAESWFSRAVSRDSVGVRGRRARVGLGDAQLQLGDTAAARNDWQWIATAGGVPDSVTQMAQDRLQRVGTAQPVAAPDTTLPRKP